MTITRLHTNSVLPPASTVTPVLDCEIFFAGVFRRTVPCFRTAAKWWENDCVPELLQQMLRASQVLFELTLIDPEVLSAMLLLPTHDQQSASTSAVP